MVHPAAGPPPGTNSDRISKDVAKGSSQKLQLFILGSAISGAPIIIGIIQLAKPTNPGMIAPKIMISACTVTIWL